jgi:hypothetical protein
MAKTTQKKSPKSPKSAPATPATPAAPAAELVPIDTLRPHPRNYVEHPEDEIDHIVESIRANGFYRNVVVARDGTILAGHGVVVAARRIGMAAVPAVRLDMDPADPRALKVLTGDNEIAHLREADDRALSELLREIKETDAAGLLGTGFDELMLANLVYVSRPHSEVASLDAAAEWTGMPDYDPGERTSQVLVNFRSREDRDEFVRRNDLVINVGKGNKSTWWPTRENQDSRSVRFEADGGGDDDDPDGEA